MEDIKPFEPLWIFRKNIKYLRKQNGLTQKQLATLLGVSEQTIYNWEREDSPDVKGSPTLKTIFKLREIFSVSLDDLFLTDLWNNL